MMPIRGIAWLYAITAGCTSETQIVSLVPTLAVQPGSLDYGEVVAGEETPSLEVDVANTGRAKLVADLSLGGDDAAAFGLDPSLAHLELLPDEDAVVPVTFAPTELRPYAATLVVASNDTLQALFPVPLSGTGRVPYAPDIDVQPTGTVDFGAVGVGEDGTTFVEVKNVGDADLHLGTITQDGAGTFHLDEDYSGATIAPGDARPIVVTYLPTQEGGDSGTVTIPSDDPDEPEVVVPLRANGGGAFDYPRAVVDCPSRVDLAGPVEVHLDGSGSTDPQGGTLTYAWSTARRPIAADQLAEPVPTDAPETDVTIDAAGTWEVQLQVTNEAGTPSVPTKCVIEAVPTDDLHVELSWGGPTSDLDLHLSLEDADLFDVPGDTSFCNPHPDWGAAGDPSDDPVLAADDDDGSGPEDINVPSPADGAYPVRVHLFDDVDDGAVTATVTVFAYGQAVWSGSKVLERNQVWEVGQVNWPDGTFGVSSEPLWDAGGRRQCE